MFRATCIAVEWIESSFQLAPVGAMHPIPTFRIGSAVVVASLVALAVAAFYLLRTRGARAHVIRGSVITRYAVELGRWRFCLRFMRTNRVGWFRDKPLPQACVPGWNPSGNIACGFFLMTYMARMKEPRGRVNDVMRRSTLAAVLALCFLAGCSSNVGQQLKAEREGLNLALTGIHTAHVVGALPVAQERAMIPYLQATQASLDAGDKAYLAGDKTTAGVYARAAAAGLQKVQQLAGATTQPSH